MDRVLNPDYSVEGSECVGCSICIGCAVDEGIIGLLVMGIAVVWIAQ